MLRSRKLPNTNFDGMDLSGQNMRNAFLKGATFRNTNLTMTDLSGANLENADLTGATLFNTKLDGANIEGIKGKLIFAFSLNGEYAYYCEGRVRMGCLYDTVDNGLKAYKLIGKKHKYPEEIVEHYAKILKFIKETFEEHKNDS
jgi:uncharacterized protein YjbI with pentapeptide repeats